MGGFIGSMGVPGADDTGEAIAYSWLLAVEAARKEYSDGAGDPEDLLDESISIFVILPC